VTIRTTRVAAGLLAAAALTAAAACSSESTTTTEGTTAPAGSTKAAAGVVVSDAWCRESPMVTGAMACYAEITNNTDSDDGLVAVTVPADVAADAQIHETTAADDMSDDMTDGTAMDDMDGDSSGGMMTMSEVDEIEVPAGETVVLAPGGYHIMLMDLVSQLSAGDTIELTLDFHESGEQTVMFEVRSA